VSAPTRNRQNPSIPRVLTKFLENLSEPDVVLDQASTPTVARGTYRDVEAIVPDPTTRVPS
jgi:hypothetical protein